MVKGAERNQAFTFYWPGVTLLSVVKLPPTWILIKHIATIKLRAAGPI